MKLSGKSLVCLVWDDAHMSLDEWTPTEIDQDFHKPQRVKTFGLLVRSDDAGVTLAMEEGMDDAKFRHTMFVPKAMVVELVDLGQPKTPRRRASRKAPAVTP